MAGRLENGITISSALDAVRRRVMALRDQAEVAEDHVRMLAVDLAAERQLRERVSDRGPNEEEP